MANETVGQIERCCGTSKWRWTLKNCHQYFRRLGSVSSPKFAIDQSNQTTNWQLHVFRSISRDMSMVGVTNLDETDVIATVEWPVLEGQRFLSDYGVFCPANKIIFSTLSSKVQCSTARISIDHSNENTLFLDCFIVVNLVLTKHKEIDRSAVLDDFQKLLDNNEHSDVTLVFPLSKIIYAHKAILSSRSPVFEAMFQRDMKGNRLNTVKITDTKYRIMKELLRFVYAGKVNDINDICKELLVAADKYCLEGLKALCERTICEQLQFDNALEILHLATTYNAAALKAKVCEYIATHIKDISRKPEFKQLDSDIKGELLAILVDEI